MGPFHGPFFQTAYLTNDLELARDQFGAAFGLKEFRRIGGPLRGGGKIAVELACAGGVMYELMQVSESEDPLYASQPGEHEPFGLVHHHYGYTVNGEQAWHQLMLECAQRGFKVVYQSETPGFMKVCFIQIPWLPHYLEYFCLEPGGRAFFESVPCAAGSPAVRF